MATCDDTSESLRQALAGLPEASGGGVKMSDEEMFHDVVSGMENIISHPRSETATE
jgi:hypothetical protein